LSVQHNSQQRMKQTMSSRPIDLSQLKCGANTPPSKLGRVILEAMRAVGQTQITLIGAAALRQTLLAYMNATAFCHEYLFEQHIVALPSFGEVVIEGSKRTTIVLQLRAVPQCPLVDQLRGAYHKDITAEHDSDPEVLSTDILLTVTGEGEPLPCRLHTLSAGALNQAVKGIARTKTKLGELHKPGATNYDLAVVFASNLEVMVGGHHTTKTTTVILPVVFDVG